MIESIGTLVIVCISIVCITVYACVHACVERDVRMYRLFMRLPEREVVYEVVHDDQYEEPQ